MKFVESIENWPDGGRQKLFISKWNFSRFNFKFKFLTFLRGSFRRQFAAHKRLLTTGILGKTFGSFCFKPTAEIFPSIPSVPSFYAKEILSLFQEIFSLLHFSYLLSLFSSISRWKRTIISHFPRFLFNSLLLNAEGI